VVSRQAGCRLDVPVIAGLPAWLGLFFFKKKNWAMGGGEMNSISSLDGLLSAGFSCLLDTVSGVDARQRGGPFDEPFRWTTKPNQTTETGLTSFS